MAIAGSHPGSSMAGPAPHSTAGPRPSGGRPPECCAQSLRPDAVPLAPTENEREGGASTFRHLEVARHLARRIDALLGEAAPVGSGYPAALSRALTASLIDSLSKLLDDRGTQGPGRRT